MRALAFALVITSATLAHANPFDGVVADCKRLNPQPGDDWKLCATLRGWAMIGPPPVSSGPDVSTVIVVPPAERPAPLYFPPAPPPVTCYRYEGTGYTRCW